MQEPKRSRWYQESITATKKRIDVLGLRIHGDAGRLQCLMSRMEPTGGPEEEGAHLSRRLPTYTSRESRSGVVRLDLLYTWISPADDQERIDFS
ncbi:unnamed protein product [Trichogramma brassicae]|uniref:Uncharacterized protein n=1 Tax=Trichogramma brassicae TaxID=86971 RepID=A0A6H5ISY9_9HYME|nr:unnamed protein product [Trichogramma brassicae]